MSANNSTALVPQRTTASQKALAGQMTKAVISEDLAALKRHVDAGVDLELAEGSGWTPLILAAWYGQGEMVRLLLGAGAKVEAKDRNDWTAYHHGCWAGHTDCVSQLVEAGADVAAVTSEGKTGRDMAVAEQHATLRAKLEELKVHERDAPPEPPPKPAAARRPPRKRARPAGAGPPGPKRALSAYMYFMKARRIALLQERPELAESVTETAKAIGAEWKALSEEQKVPYAAEAAEDKARYARELAALPEDQRPLSKRAHTPATTPSVRPADQS